MKGYPTMLNITHEAASAAILMACDEGRIVQGVWHERASDGRALACLLGAIDPSVPRAAWAASRAAWAEGAVEGRVVYASLFRVILDEIEQEIGQ